MNMIRTSILIIPAFLLAALCAALPAGAADTGTLIIEVTGFKSNSGVAQIGVANSEATFEADTPFKGFTVPISGHRAFRAVTGLAYGEYAVKVFHDKNHNNKLDTRIFGIPAESYGFSNDARAPFGPPAYKNAAFLLDAPEKTIRIQVKPYLGTSNKEKTK